MPSASTAQTRKRTCALLAALMASLCTALVLPAAGHGQVITFGSPLAVPATLNTAENLNYPGTYTAVPPAPDAPNGVYHTYHYGADTALWNFSDARGATRVPSTGQALKLEVEGCAQRAAGGPRPLTTIHFQDLKPMPDGGAKVSLTSQGFDLPVCGEGGAGASTVTTYVPVNLCVSAGDYVGFNDSGGYVPYWYPSGVPYQVLGAVAGSTMDSFIKDQGTGNGAVFSPSVTSANDGFATNRDEELMMRVTLGTGIDATHICPGGRQGLPPPLPPIRVSPQTDGLTHHRIVAVALFCRVSPCNGVATITANGGRTYGRKGFAIEANTTVHLPIRVRPELVRMVRRRHGVMTTLTAEVAGAKITQQIGVKIF